MEDTNIPRFPGNLDPRAQEFFPRNLLPLPYHLPLIHPDIYYPYPSPSPPPPPPPLYHHPQFSAPPPAYVGAGIEPSSLVVAPCVSSSLPPLPSRALLLSMVPADVSESTVRRDLEVFGDVRSVQMERLRDGIVTVHFYDLRQARQALMEIQEQNMQQQYRLRLHYEAVLAQNSLNLLPPHLHHPLPPMPPPAPGLVAGRAVWAQFTVPVASSLPDGNNQGTLVIFNLDPKVTTSSLKEIFEAFGHVKELRETPMKRHQKFVEFYDVRDAAKAMAEMNGKEIHGKQIVIEFSRPGGHISKKFLKANRGGLASDNNNNTSNSLNAYSKSTLRITPQSPPPPSSPPMSRRAFNAPMRSHRSQAQLYDKKKFIYSKGNPKRNGDSRSSSSGSSSIQNSMASLNVNGIFEESANVRFSNSKKNGKRSGNGTSSSKFHQHQIKSGAGKSWKGSSRRSKEYDPRFLINEDAIMESNCRDSRTTVMIKNIPNKYSQKLLLNMLDNHCIHCNEQIADGEDQPLSSYDFVYLPIDFINKCNVGYGFVNMTSTEATWRLYKAFHNQSWEVFNSRKICEVTYARLQGVEALKEHFKNSKFFCEDDEYMPVIFSPPRDGRQLSEPVPIFGRSSMSPPPLLLCSPSSPAVSSNDESENGEIYGGGDFQDDEVDGHINDNDDVDGNQRNRRSSSSNGGDSGDYYYDGRDDVGEQLQV